MHTATIKRQTLSIVLAFSMLFGFCVPGSAAGAEQDSYQRFEVSAGETVTLESELVLSGTERYGLDPCTENGGIASVAAGGALTKAGGSIEFGAVAGEDCMGGAILNYGTVTLTDGICFNGNSAVGNRARGGAICNFGILNIISREYAVYFRDNLVSGENAEGGAIYNGENGSIFLKSTVEFWFDDDTFVNDGTVYWVLADAEPEDNICLSDYAQFINRGELVLLVDDDTAAGTYQIAAGIYSEDTLQGKDCFRVCTEADPQGAVLRVGEGVSYHGSRYLLQYDPNECGLNLTVINTFYEDGFGDPYCSFDTYEIGLCYYGGYTFEGWYQGDTMLEDKADEEKGAVYTARWKYGDADVTMADYTLVLSNGKAYRDAVAEENLVYLNGLTYDTEEAVWKAQELHFVTVAEPALNIVGAVSLELNGISGVGSVASESVGVVLDDTLTLSGTGSFYAFGDCCAVSDGSIVSTRDNLHVRTGNSGESTQYGDCYSGERYALFEQHTHQWTNYQVSQEGSFTYLTAECSDSDGGHNGSETAFLMLWPEYGNQWNTQIGELLVYDMAFFGTLCDYIDTSALTVWYEGTGDTVYEKTTVKPTLMGTYQASVEIGGETLTCAANVRRNIAIRADDVTALHGGPEQALTYTVEGLAEGEHLTGIKLTREPGTEPGEYEITMEIPDENRERFSITELILGGSYYRIQPRITFDTMGGEPMEPVGVDYDSSDGYVLEPAKKDGYVFNGWYLDAALTKRWDADKPIKEDMMLYAGWALGGDITGSIEDNSDKTIDSICLYLVQGKNRIVRSWLEGGETAFTLKDVPAGSYQLVIDIWYQETIDEEETNSFREYTSVVEMGIQNMDLGVITMPDWNTNAGIYDTEAVLYGLENFQAEPGDTIEFTLYETEANGENIGQQEIAAIAEGKTLRFYDCSLFRTDAEGKSDRLSDCDDVVFTLKIPFHAEQKDVKLFRWENETASALTALSEMPAEPVDGTYYLDKANGFLLVNISYFGTYAIGCSDKQADNSVYGVILWAEEDVSPKSSTDFSDVQEEDYYYGSVLWAVENGIINGRGDGLFAPDDVTTRAEMVTYLWRAAGCPMAEGVLPFTDVSEADDYVEAVRWAAAEGIVYGVSSGVFAPDVPLTRAQAVTILYRYAKASAFSNGTEDGFALSPYADVIPGTYYYDAVLWADGQAVTRGTGSGFAPDAYSTRCQSVTFLYRLFAD